MTDEIAGEISALCKLIKGANVHIEKLKTHGVDVRFTNQSARGFGVLDGATLISLSFALNAPPEGQGG